MNKILVGRIVGTSGIKGYVRIHTFTEDPNDIIEFKNIFDENDIQYKIQKIISIKGSVTIAQIKNLTSINDAEKLIGTELFIDRKELPESNEYYYADLINMSVLFENNIIYGKIVNVTNYGASDILEIEEQGTGKLVMYPFSDDFVLSVDMNAKTLIVKKLEVL